MLKWLFGNKGRRTTGAATDETSRQSHIQNDQHLKDVVDSFVFSFELSASSAGYYASSEMANIYIAAARGGGIISRSLLTVDKRLAELWGEGDSKKSGAFITVWTSQILVDLLRIEDPADPDVPDLVKTLSERISGIDEDDVSSTLVNHLVQRQNQKLNSSDPMQGSGGGIYTWFYVYLWCLKALGYPIDLKVISVPITDVTSIVNEGVVDSKMLQMPGEMLSMTKMYVTGLRAAREIYESLEERRLAAT